MIHNWQTIKLWRKGEKNVEQRRKSLITLSIAASVGFGIILTSFPLNPVHAESNLEDLKRQQSEIGGQRVEVETKLGNTNDEINKLQDQQAQVKNEISKLGSEIAATENQIAEKNSLIEEANANIEELKTEIQSLEERITKRNELLKGRAVSLQESGGVVNYIDVLLGAQSFTDFIDRINAVAVIMDADQKILQEQKTDKLTLEEKQAQVQQELADLQKMRQDLEAMRSNLNKQKADKDNLILILQADEQEAEEEKMSLEEEQQILAAQQAAAQKAVELEQARLAEEKRKAEEERRRQEEERKRQEQEKGNEEKSGSNEQVPSPPASAGAFTKPAAGYLSSGFGYRSGGFHYGVDIAAAGTVPIVAAASGVVINSYTSSSYGEVVLISHSIDGQQYTTVYAHMRSESRAVQTGDIVAKGQLLGYMGNTGHSFGQHLHFELHRGPWNPQKSNAINPIGIVPL
ncbi:peptidoglycan DD-metalloendopeptidase family protein [Bacillaceae bacterium Marseille-Q3522]|nr:peptidoglycan DD-metalloendopeptidase family protein [Bacillaceae bacterium Marseille-Q3522]